MPLYEFKCSNSDTPHTFEKRLPFEQSDSQPPCPHCGHISFRVLLMPYVKFFGDGWTTKSKSLGTRPESKREAAKLAEQRTTNY